MELPAIEPTAKSDVSCRNAAFDDAEQPETTRGFTERC
jgi:hypothetical protein